MEPFDSGLPFIGLAIVLLFMLGEGIINGIRGVREAWALRATGPYGPLKARAELRSPRRPSQGPEDQPR